MKKLILILLIFTSGAYAQDGKHEKIKALKTAYITEKLALTNKEAQTFWPIYNRYDVKFHDLRTQERNEIFKKLQDGVDNLNDSEANALLDKSFKLDSDELDLRKEMTQDLRKVISVKQIITLKKAEYDFKRELLDRYRNSKDENDCK